jgi:poly-gamma-glutamate capsule biosynthesis protein CapA/YwtB (metallophosphatase superfamily)
VLSWQRAAPGDCRFRRQPPDIGGSELDNTLGLFIASFTWRVVRGAAGRTVLTGKHGRSVLIASAIAIAAGAAWAQSSAITVVLTGQSMIRSDIRLYTPSVVSTMSPLLKGDVVFTNFEATVAEKGQPNEDAPHQGNSLAPPEAMDALKDMGFNLFALSNNHSWDLGVPGIQNAIREADHRGIVHAGTGNTVAEAVSPGYLRTSKGTIALVGIASGLIRPEASATASRPGVDALRVETDNKPNQQDSKLILQSIRDARTRADIVIVYQHNHVYDKDFGTIFAEELPDRLAPPDWIKKWTHEEVDAGADIVVMHGAPVVQGVEIYRDKPIFYDLGNFIFNLPLTEATSLLEPIVWESVVASVQFQGRNLQSIEFRPITLNQMGRGQVDSEDDHPNSLPEFPRPFIATRGLPTPATGEKAHYILERLADSSRPFGTTVEIKGDTAEINAKGRN